jgi:diguanylate cyclase (GGDEF)-like protein/PAS domain S-box-containing protein
MAQSILLIQDDPSDAKAIREALINSNDGSFHVEWVRRCSEGLERLIEDGHEGTLRADSIAAVLLDLSLPDSHGVATFDQLFRAAPQIPILVLSSSQDEDIAKLAVQHGAQDYLLKDRLDSYLLPKTLRSMLERAAIAEALFDEKERAQVTLNSIGDAVMSIDLAGGVTYLNAVAESMTGWTREEAAGRPVEEVLRIIDSSSRATALNPMALAMRQDKTVGLTANCVLIRCDGSEAAIEDSAAPIHNRRGQVTGAVMVFHDVTMARAMTLKMSYLAQHDSLTDLPNRLMFQDRLAQAIALAHRHRQKLAVLFVDMDGFKPINDSLGHAIGDRLLQSVAQRLQACVRGSDTVCRHGGDEFVILLTEVAHAEDAAAVADKILLTLRSPHRIGEHNLHVTGSIGIVTYPDDGTEADALMSHADLAMYHSKENGRDNYQFFKPELNVRAIERQALEYGLRDAIDRHEFVLHYQPKMNLRTGRIVGVEALIRWHHSERGLVPAAQFIPVAEECGFIVSIGRWVLHEACRQAQAWQDAGLPAISIAINISARELRAKDMVSGLRAILTDTGLAPQCLELELNESILMQDLKSTEVVLGFLKDMGVQLALDDFGTGYSSLNYLKRLPIDILKIDRSFVNDLTTDADDASIVSAVVSMGKSLHMRVVAEGVETHEQLEILQEQGCPQGQGYYFSQPAAAETFAQMLMRDAAQVRWPDRRASRKSPLESATANRANPVTQFTG